MLRMTGFYQMTTILKTILLVQIIKLCVKNNGKINFVVMMLQMILKKFSNELNGYECDIEF